MATYGIKLIYQPFSNPNVDVFVAGAVKYAVINFDDALPSGWTATKRYQFWTGMANFFNLKEKGMCLFGALSGAGFAFTQADMTFLQNMINAVFNSKIPTYDTDPGNPAVGIASQNVMTMYISKGQNGIINPSPGLMIGGANSANVFGVSSMHLVNGDTGGNAVWKNAVMSVALRAMTASINNLPTTNYSGNN